MKAKPAAIYAARLAATTARLANMPHRANILMKHKVFGEVLDLTYVVGDKIGRISGSGHQVVDAMCAGQERTLLLEAKYWCVE
jgi:hypothetical protein